MRRRLAATILAATTIAGALVPVRASRPLPAVDLRSPYVADHVLVRFAQGTPAHVERSIVRTLGGSVFLRAPRIGMTAIRLPAGVGVPAAIETLRRFAAVEIAEPDYTGALATHTASGVPEDPCATGCSVGKQWDIAAVNAIAGWRAFPGTFPTGAQRASMNLVKVAVLDTKIDRSMADWINAGTPATAFPEDAANGGQLALADAKDFVPTQDQQGALDYHGTFVAGIVGAAINNTVGIAGFGALAQIIPVTVVDGRGQANASYVAAGIDWAVARGAKVINASFGLSADSSFVRTAVQNAFRADRLVVAAAGNFSNDQPFFPAWYPGAMSVTATREDDRIGGCSNFSERTSVAAPGVGIVSLDPKSPSKLRKEVCGTSTAAPHVSALAALLYAQTIAAGETPTATQIKQTIEATADDPYSDVHSGRDAYYGWGRINFERALREREGDLPHVLQILTTFPKPQGGVSHGTAFAYALGERPIVGAEWFLDQLGPPGTGGPVDSADGTWGEHYESLEIAVEAPLSISPGVHHLFVRARDEAGVWGPAAVGVVIVDRTAPVFEEVGATPGSAIAVGSVRRPVRISFSATDDHATQGAYTFTVTREAAGQVQQLYKAPSLTPVPFPARVTREWMPEITASGPVTITVELYDEAGNRARKAVTTVVL